MLRTTAILFCLYLPLSTFAQELPDDHLPVPIMRQATGYSCGAAALLSILHFYKVSNDSESDLYEPLGTSEKNGTHPLRMADHAKSLGLNVEFRERLTIDDLRSALKSKSTVILDIQAWREDKNVPWRDIWEDGHYVVLIGIDEKYAYLMDPSTGSGYTYIPLKELPERWHDYEDETGKRREYHQLGIIIKGKKKMSEYPTKLQRLE